MAAELVRKRLVVSGQVQGVWFRDSTRERARVEGVSGWASNLSNGTVEVVLEGSPGGVARVVRFCEIGPRSARVERVVVVDEPPQGLAGFEIR
jgi:acylphosphatase